MVDEARVRAIRERAGEALGDLETAGLVGLAAIRGCARAQEQLERLDGANAAATLAELRATKRELDMIEQAFAKGLHKKALELAFGRTHATVDAVVRDLAEALGERP